MRTVTAGNGSDSTAATQAYLASTPSPLVRDLIIIGPPDSPSAIYMTDHEAPLVYSIYGRPFPTAVVKRDRVTAKIGLDSNTLSITWSPSNQTATVNTATASPFQKAAQHFYDNWPVLVLRCFMPTAGDANTLGCAIWFGGRVNTCSVKRNQLVFNCRDYLDVVKEKVPTTVIESTNTLASTAAVTLPTSPAGLPLFACFTGSSETQVIADCTSPDADNIYAGNIFAGGYMVFLSGAGATLAGFWTAIAGNGEYTDGDGNHHSIFSVYQPLPWPPTPTVDTFYVSMQAPADISESAINSSFPYVPAPQQAV
jgi:hypothetical protein